MIEIVQDVVDYFVEFGSPKIVYPNICRQPEFTIYMRSLYINQKCFAIGVDDKFLLTIFNSKVTYFLFKTFTYTKRWFL
jgi:adenine-specific DNA-methyltransferase